MIAYVTGAAGFLGSHLVEKLLSNGASVVGIDNFVTGSRKNLAAADADHRFFFVEADVSRSWDCAAALSEPFRAPELILHFASPASPVDYGNDPLGTMAVNALGTMHACELARRTGARVLVASTSETYGDPLEHPQRETYWGNVNPIGVRACYDESKRYAEAFLTSAVRVNGIDGRLVRIFNTYGPRMQPNDGRVIPNFCMSALRGEALTIYGDGKQTRSLRYIDDVVEGFYRLATRPGLAWRVVNIGNRGEFTIRELAGIAAKLAQTEYRAIVRLLPPGYPTRRRPDIWLARTLLDWEPRTSLRHGLTRTLAYFRGLEPAA